MTMRNGSQPSGSRSSPVIRSPRFRVLIAALLGVLAALLVACASSGKGLIPTGNAGPLQSDFEAVAQAAQNGDGSCTATETALLKTERDFDALPFSVDAGLRSRLREGISKLRSDALALCKQPLPQATVTTTTPRTTPSTQTTPTTPTATQTTPRRPPPTTSTPRPRAPTAERLPPENRARGNGPGGAGAGGAGSGAPKVGGGQEGGK